MGGTGFDNLNPLKRGKFQVVSGPGLLGTDHGELPPASFPASDHGPLQTPTTDHGNREPLRVVVRGPKWSVVALFLDLSGGCNHGEELELKSLRS